MAKHVLKVEEEDAVLQHMDRRGEIDPNSIIETARDPRHVLHKKFEWDDTKAAHQHRLNQARQLIRAVVVTRSTVQQPTPIPVKAFVKSPDPDNSPRYRSTMKIRDVVGDIQVTMLRELRRALSIKKNMRDLALTWDVDVTKLDESIAQLQDYILILEYNPEKVIAERGTKEIG